MLAVPPPPVKPNRDGRYVGLGWDAVHRTAEGVRYSKHGGKAGVRAWLEHLPDGVNWALLFNTSDASNDADKRAAALPEAARARPRSRRGVGPMSTCSSRIRDSSRPDGARTTSTRGRADCEEQRAK
jgi:hypothetical protein